MYIKDNYSGKTRLYGTDHHDSLVISDNGKYLTYYNLQCGEGSKYGSFSFVTDEKGTLPKDDEVLMEHGAFAYFNIGGFGNIDDVLSEIEAKILDKYISANGEIGPTVQDILQIIRKYRTEKEEQK